ncbi:hypothetical protein RM61_15085 [Xanthomonas phaseoli pv. phaseoli]|nr:hypothetical protein RM61_15085 [Xanthomonas phaseoli pv. phaseoli]
MLWIVGGGGFGGGFGGGTRIAFAPVPQDVITSATITQVRTFAQKCIQAGAHGFCLQSVCFTVLFSQGGNGIQARDGLAVADDAVGVCLPQLFDLDLQLLDVGAQLGAVLHGLLALGPAIAGPCAGKQRRNQQ